MTTVREKPDGIYLEKDIKSLTIKYRGAGLYITRAGWMELNDGSVFWDMDSHDKSVLSNLMLPAEYLT